MVWFAPLGFGGCLFVSGNLPKNGWRLVWVSTIESTILFAALLTSCACCFWSDSCFLWSDRWWLVWSANVNDSKNRRLWSFSYFKREHRIDVTGSITGRRLRERSTLHVPLPCWRYCVARCPGLTPYVSSEAAVNASALLELGTTSYTHLYSKSSHTLGLHIASQIPKNVRSGVVTLSLCIPIRESAVCIHVAHASS